MNSPRNKVYYYGNKHEKYVLRKYFPLINHQILPWIFDVVMHISPGGLFLFILKTKLNFSHSLSFVLFNFDKRNNLMQNLFEYMKLSDKLF